MVRHTGQQMVGILSSESDTHKLAIEFEDFVNNFSPDITGFIQSLHKSDITLQHKFTDIALLWIRRLSFYSMNNWYDLRNEYSVKTAHTLVGLLKDVVVERYEEYKGYVEEPTEFDFKSLTEDEEKEDFNIVFVETLSKTHRTLQQTFSGLVFRWLLQLDKEPVNTPYKAVGDIVNNYAKDNPAFFKTPLI